MLGALATVVVVGALVGLSLVPVSVVAVPVVAVGGALAWSRADAQAQRRARMAARQAHRRASQLRPLVEPTARPAEPTAPPAEPSADLEPVTTPEPSTVVRDELYDVQAVESERVAAEPVAAEQAAATPVVPARPLVDDDDIPLTWDPVPVPRPTYTMKARVTRPAPTSADLVGDADTEYAAYDEAPERRVAGA
jgi:hypothetical protein